MESQPPKIAELFVYWLVPPACREEVLGDMRERYHGPAQYLVEAASTVPSVIYSRIRRTTDAVIALMEAVSIFTAYAMAAWWLNRPMLIREYGFARLAIPSAIFLAAIILADAYSDPRKHSPLKPLLGPTIGFALTYVLELNRGWALPLPILAWGGAFSVLIVSTIRLAFPPLAERPQIASIPAFWQKLELLPPSFSLKVILLPCLILLVIILHLLTTLISHS
ncbi:hypothetical protein ACFPT7_09400 [Acidicapsa dinghuensis]|uniref:Uncharacterized protein n=1 Tax=Acidicapsa dinghuensis TaxID=2218256 RepID=A0ABW1EEI5_9BACT|nr:hypothetical protein [Acidicapsa dinghuensis]